MITHKVNEIARSSNVPVTKISSGIAMVQEAQRLYGTARQIWSDRFTYSVSISEKDPLYTDVHQWLLSILPDERHKSLLVSSNKVSTSNRVLHDSVEEEPATKKPLTIRFNDRSNRSAVIDGHKITVTLQIPEPSAGTLREPEASNIVFEARTYQGQQAVIRHLNLLNDERSSVRKAVLRMVGSWGSWTTRSDLPARTMTSVSLPESQKNRIVADLKTFLDAEDQYNRLAIPWHRGYMFHGPPGTGKTSIVKALAKEFNLDLWYISLADLNAESSLLGLLSEVGPRSILLLEDIDTMKITNENESSESGKISIGSLLNTLDGVTTPHGLITMMTTNHFEKLDPRLTRAGRMDLIEKLDYPSSRTLSNLFKHFYGSYPTWTVNDEPIIGVSVAQVSEIFKRHLSNPQKAAHEVEMLVLAKLPV